MQEGVLSSVSLFFSSYAPLLSCAPSDQLRDPPQVSLCFLPGRFPQVSQLRSKNLASFRAHRVFLGPGCSAFFMVASDLFFGLKLQVSLPTFPASSACFDRWIISGDFPLFFIFW